MLAFVRAFARNTTAVPPPQLDEFFLDADLPLRERELAEIARDG